jgi:hypothetical protein
MNPFVSSGEDNNEEGGEHSEDKGDYAEEEIPHIGEVTGAIQSKVFVVNTDLHKHEEDAHLISAIFPHKIVGLNLLSGVGHVDLHGSVDSHYFANKSNMSVTSIKHSKQYVSRKRAEELTKHRRDKGGGNGDGDGGASDLLDSNESEDEEAKLLTSWLDVQILRLLRAIKSGNEKVYDKILLFFENDDGSSDDGGGCGRGSKPKRYRDVVHKQILEQMKKEEAAEGKGARMVENGDNN